MRQHSHTHTHLYSAQINVERSKGGHNTVWWKCTIVRVYNIWHIKLQVANWCGKHVVEAAPAESKFPWKPVVEISLGRYYVLAMNVELVSLYSSTVHMYLRAGVLRVCTTHTHPRTHVRPLKHFVVRCLCSTTPFTPSQCSRRWASE